MATPTPDPQAIASEAMRLARRNGWTVRKAFRVALRRTMADARRPVDGPYYHGGLPGFEPGDILRPRAETGADPLPSVGSVALGRARAAGYVFLTPDVSVAWSYAKARDGWVYEAEPLGDIEQDPDHDRAVRTRLAKVVRVVEYDTRTELARLRARLPA